MNYANTRYVGLGHYDHIIWMIPLSMITKSIIHCSWILIFFVPQYIDRVKKKVFSKIQLTWSDRVITMYDLNEWMNEWNWPRHQYRSNDTLFVKVFVQLCYKYYDLNKWRNKWMNEWNLPRHQCRLPPNDTLFVKVFVQLCYKYYDLNEWRNKWMNEWNLPRHQCRLPPNDTLFVKVFFQRSIE